MRTINLCITILCVVCFVVPGHAQDDVKNKKHHNIRLGVEFGTDFFFGDPIKPKMVRESKSSYHSFHDYDYYCGLIPNYQEMNVMYVGVKPEFYFCRNRIGLSTGLRVSRYSTTLDSDRDYFLWLLHEDDVYTEFVKIREINQNNYYLGVPLEFRFFPNKRELPVQFYVKGGSTFNYRLFTNNKVKFQNKSMNSNAETVGDQANSTLRNFNAYMFAGFGLKIGGFSTGYGKKFPYINVEAHILNIMLTDKASSFMRTNAGLGFQLSAQIPLGKTVPIGTR